MFALSPSLEPSTDIRDESPMWVMIRKALEASATGIHIFNRSAGASVFFRVDGMLVPPPGEALEHVIDVVEDLKTHANLHGAEEVPLARAPKGRGFFTRDVGGRQLEFCVATAATPDVETVIMNIRDPNEPVRGLDDLGLRDVEAWCNAAATPGGLCVISGLVESGRSTTMAATVAHVQARLGVTVCVIDELRDAQGAALAVASAEAGHAVITVMHGGSSPATVMARLEQLGINPDQQAVLLRGVLAQHLVRKGAPGLGRVLVSALATFNSAGDVVRTRSGELTWPTIEQAARELCAEGTLPEAEVQRAFGAAVPA